MQTTSYSRGDKDFENVLDALQEKYFHSAGGEECETIINWNKREAREDGVVSLYAANSVVAAAIKRCEIRRLILNGSIKRCRKGIRKVDVLSTGVNMYFDKKYVRPMHMILKVVK